VRRCWNACAKLWRRPIWPAKFSHQLDQLEVIGHADTLQPDPFALVEAARVLCADGFQVFPYTTEDIVVGEKLIEAGFMKH